jgi:uncharacterized protein (UPF0216 family)
MDYLLWQMPMKQSPTIEISDALKHYINKHGLLAQIILETSLEQLELPVELNVVQKLVRIPKNILLIGKVDDVAEDS